MKEISIKKTFTFTGHNAGIYTLCHGFDEHCVISGSADKFIAQWNFEKGEQGKFSAKFPAAVYSLLALYEQDQLWVGTANGHIHVIDKTKKEEIHAFRFHKTAVFDLKYCKKHNLVFSAGADGILNVYDPQNLKHVHSLKLSASKIRSIACYDDEIFIAEGTGKTIVLATATLEKKTEFQSHKDASNCYMIAKTGDLLFSGGRDAHLNVWDIKNNFSLIKSIPAHNFAIYKILSLGELDLLATASRDKTFKIWDQHTLQVLARINKENYEGHTHSVNSLLWHQHSQTLLSCSDDRTLMSWKIESA